MTITIQLPETDDEMYCLCDGQTSPQPCYLQLDPTARTARYDYSGEIGGGMPASVWHGTVRRYTCPPLTRDGAERLTRELRPLLDRVVAGYSEEWDGSNHVPHLTEDADEAEHEIEYIVIPRIPEEDMVIVWDAADWMADIGDLAAQAAELEITADTTDAQLIAIEAAVESDARSEGVHYLEGLGDHLEDIRRHMDELAHPA